MDKNRCSQHDCFLLFAELFNSNNDKLKLFKERIKLQSIYMEKKVFDCFYGCTKS